MKAMFKDALILFLITLIAGLSLGGVYAITKEPIAISEEKRSKEAYREVFADAESFDEIEAKDLDNDSFALSTWTEKGYKDISVKNVLEAKDGSGSLVGYVLVVNTKEGYGGDIKFTMGITNDGTLNGVSILSISETAGLGMRAEEVLKPQFENKNVAEFNLVKTGKTSENEIDAISGATITSTAFTKAVNAGLFYYQSWLGGEKNE